jgi:hypothetical protein
LLSIFSWSLCTYIKTLRIREFSESDVLSRWDIILFLETWR